MNTNSVIGRSKTFKGPELAKSLSWKVYKRSEGGFIFSENLLVRVAENVPVEYLEPIIAFLTSSDGVTGMTLSGKPLSGEWKTHMVWTDESPTKGVNGTPAYRLFHALTTQDTGDGLGPYVMENGCMYLVTYQFFWRQPEPPTIEQKSESGVAVSIKNIHRREEDGLWSWIVETRTQQTQIVDWYISGRSFDSHEETKQIIGIREDGTGSDGASVDEDIPESVEPGETWSKSVQKRENCTHDTTIRKTVDEMVDLNSRLTSETQYERVVQETHRNQQEPIEDATKAEGGVIQQNQFELNKNGLYDNTEKKTTELPVEEAVVTKGSTVFQESESVTHKHQAEPIELTSAGKGESKSIRVEKTPGGLHDNTEETTRDLPVDEASRSCAKTIFEHTESVTSLNQEEPIGEATDAGGGLIHKTVSEITKTGLHNNTEQTTEELPVEEARIAKSADFFSESSSRTDVNQPERDVVLDENVERGTSVSKSSERTPGGSWNNTEEKVVEREIDPRAVDVRTTFTEVNVQLQRRIDDGEIVKPEDLSKFIPALEAGELGDIVGTIDNESRALTKTGLTDHTQQADYARKQIIRVENFGGTLYNNNTDKIYIFNHTSKEVQDLLQTESNGRYSVSLDGGVNKFGLIDGTITVYKTHKDGGGGSVNTSHYSKSRAEYISVSEPIYSGVYQGSSKIVDAIRSGLSFWNGNAFLNPGAANFGAMIPEQAEVFRFIVEDIVIVLDDRVDVKIAPKATTLSEEYSSLFPINDGRQNGSRFEALADGWAKYRAVIQSAALHILSPARGLILDENLRSAIIEKTGIKNKHYGVKP